MHISTHQAKQAGRMSDQLSWTDEELLLLLQTTELVVSFLEAKGRKWFLAWYPLMEELDHLRQIAIARKLK